MSMAYDLNLREYWRTIRKRKGIIIFTIVMMTLSSFVFSMLGRPTPIYKTSASVKVEKTGSVTGLYVQAVSWSSTNYTETQMAVIKSYFIMEFVAKKMGLIPPDISSEEARGNPRYLSTILGLKGRVETEQEGNSDIITITTTSEDPKQAQRLANTVAQVYKEQHALDLNRRALEAKKFIESQLVVVREKLQKSENAIKEFRESNRMVSFDSQSSALLARYVEIDTKIKQNLAIQEKINEIAKLLARAEENPLSSKTSFYIEDASTMYKNLNDRLVQLMLDRDLLLINFTDNFPQVIEIKKQLHEITTSMRSQLESQRQNIARVIDLAQKQLKIIDDQLKDLPTKGLEMVRLQREMAVNQEVYTLLEKQHQESLIRDAEKIEEVQIVKPALEPSSPINPPKTQATTGLGFILGIILGVIFAFVIETFDTSIGAVEEVEEFLGVRVLGIVPYIDFDELRMTLQERSDKEIDDDQLWRSARLVSHFAPKTTSAEAYRALRTNINFVKLETQIKTIVFTSSSPQEGKTTCSCNLAIAMAQAGHKVLLVDGDFRRPVVSKVFGIHALPGLTDVILGNYEWRRVVRSITDIMMGKMTMEEIMITPGLDNLSIITCGTIAPNPAELVNTRANADFLKEAHEEYDFVIIDAPPVLAATDAAIWGTKADGVIIVYQVGKVARGALKRAKAQIDNVKAKIIGVVLNGLKAEISPDFEYHDKYYYYYGSDRKRKLSLGDRVLSWPEQIKQRAKDFPQNLKDFLKDKDKRKLPAGIKSAAIKLFLLLLAIALMVAGLYYQRVIPKPVRVPIKLGANAVLVPPLEGDRKSVRTAEIANTPVLPVSTTSPLPPGAVLLIWEGEPSNPGQRETRTEGTIETYPEHALRQTVEAAVIISQK